MKILHLPTAVGGNSWGLSQGERGLGLDSKVLVASQGPFRYPADIDLGLTPDLPRATKFAKSLAAFLKVRRRYQIFHFNYGSSLIHWERLSALRLWDLPYYPKEAKLFVTYNGCDARQKYPTMERTAVAACHNDKCYGGMCNSGEKDKARRASIAKMAQHVEHMFALNPDLLYFLPPEKSSFLPYTVSAEGVEVAPPDINKKKLTILHAPTNREAKGSDYILAALDRLAKRFPVEFEVILVEGLSHADAMACYQRADLIIDQLLIGWYGGFAVETMLMGKPVIARVALDDLHFIPKEMRKDLLEGIINADPSSLDEVLSRCLEDRSFLTRKSEAGREYALKWHDPLYVAGLAREQYERALCAGSVR